MILKKLKECLSCTKTFILIFSCNLICPAQITLAKTEVFFSPKGGCEKRVVQLIDSSKTKLDAAIYSLNNSRILEAIRRAKARGVKIRILLDRVQASGKGNRIVTLGLKDDGFNIRLHSKNRIQHNKFAIFDTAKVITGSFNWTNPAEQSNEENCLILDDSSIVKKFDERFDQHLWIVNSEAKSSIMMEKLRKQ